MVFLTIGLAIYYAGFDTPFYYDSAAKLEARRHFFDRGFISALNVFPQRPLPVASFYVDYLAFGLQSGYYRAVDVAILSAVAVVAAALLLRILAIPGIWSRGSPAEKKALSVSLGLLYLVHPIQLFVTLYVWQRMALMASLFYLASLCVYVSVRSHGFKRNTLGYGLSLLLFVCAMLSKETSVTLPIVLIIFELAFFRAQWRHLCARIAVFVIIVGAMIWVNSQLQHPHGDVNATTGILDTLSVYYTESGITLYRVLLTQARVLFSYLSLIVAPFPTKVQLISPQVIAHSLFAPPITLAWVIGAFALTVAGGIFIRFSPLSGTGILFMVVNLIPEPVLAPQYSFFGYRAVLPMFGVLLVLADCVRFFLDSVEQPRLKRLAGVGICTVLIGLAVLLGVATNNKALVWGDRVRFWMETVEQFPPLSRNMETRSAAQAYANLGWALCAERRCKEALSYLDSARTLSPGQASILATLAFAYAKVGNPAKAEHLFADAIALNPDLAFAHKEFGLMLLNLGRREEARFHLQRARDLAPYEKSVQETLERMSNPDIE